MAVQISPYHLHSWVFCVLHSAHRWCLYPLIYFHHWRFEQHAY
jgi:hypothetical protein